jgi:RHS repeat-associated protein
LVPDGVFHADEQIAFGVVRGSSWDRLDPELPFIELRGLSPDQLRLVAALMLCEVRNGARLMFYPATEYATLGDSVSTRQQPSPRFVHWCLSGAPKKQRKRSGFADSKAPWGLVNCGTVPSLPCSGFNGHVNDASSGMVYMQARYYSPDIGRFASVDPKPRKPGEIPSFGRYVYTNNNPITNTDMDGRDCSTRDGMTRCVTVAYDVSFRAQPGFRDFSSSSLNYHFYSTPVITANVTLAQARAGIVSQPTPGYPMSASEQGTKNDATPGIGGIVPGLYLSPVVSLTSTNRLDGQPVVVNVTLGSHVLAPGVVVREAVPASGGGVLVQSWGRVQRCFRRRGQPTVR